MESVLPRSMRTPLALAATWMSGWLVMMLVMAIAGREVLRELDVFQVMELRSLIGFAMLWPLVHAAGGLRAMGTARLGQHVLRNVAHYAAQYCWLAALLLIPLAQVVAIEFTMPIWSAALAVALLGERMDRGKWIAVALGLAGVVAIVRPSASALDIGHLVALASAVGFSASVVLVKSLTRTDEAVKISFWMLVVQGAIGLVPALQVWVLPSAVVWGWATVVSFCGVYAHYCLARAMAYAPATVLVPMDFVRVPLTAVLGWAVYGEAADAFTFAGVLLIFAGNLLNLRRRG
jgi:drug/metabolite transporter (DMT)-like permease